MIKGITFDLWHTVLREPMENFTGFLKEKRSEAMMEVLHGHGLSFPIEEVERAYDVQTDRLWEIWNRGAEIDQKAQIGVMLSALGIPAKDIDEVLVEDLLGPYNDAISLVPPVPFDGASELFAGLRGKGISLAIVSNTGRTHGEFFRELMDTLDLARYFDVMTFSNEMGIRKPNEAIFLRTLEKMGVSAKDALHVGDHPATDIVGARNAGMRGVLLRKPGWDQDESKADFVISELREVLYLVEELEGMD